MTPSMAEAIEPLDVLEFQDAAEMRGNIHKWLHEERLNRTTLNNNLENQPIALTLQDQTVYRFPYEHVHLRGQVGSDIESTLEVGGNMDIVWCAMLYGRADKVMPHLTRTLLLGHQLRTQIEPKVRAQGYSFANVLFVTSESLNEDALRAVANFWSIRLVRMPEVHPDRLSSLSEHLKDEVQDEHVFLKHEAWALKAGTTMISDVDFLVLNPHRMANFLMECDANTDFGQMLTRGRAAVMSRTTSRVNEDARPRLEGTSNRHRRGASTEHMDKLSYCFAVIRPSAELGQAYRDAMMRPPPAPTHKHQGPLSDQDLLNEILHENYVLLPHNVVMFPSWLNHMRLTTTFVPEVLHMANVKTLRDLPLAIEHFATQFAAVHFSKSFDPWKSNPTFEEIRAGFVQQPGGTVLCRYDNHKVTQDDWADMFCMPMYHWLRSRVRTEIDSLKAEIARCIGSSSPGLGMSKALVALTVNNIEHLMRRQPPQPRAQQTNSSSSGRPPTESAPRRKSSAPPWGESASKRKR